MARPPVASGEIPEGGAIELLREVETRSLTGVLEFEAIDGDARGEIAFFGGEIAVEQQPRDDGLDPVDVLLGIGAARYRLHQRLPPLPVSKGNDWQKSGSLAVHVPADLMNYCEHAGLTGVLELRHEDRRAEAIYRGGELLAIELDGEDAADLQEVFGWERGRFRIELDAGAPARVESEPEEEAPTQEWKPAPPKKREDTRQFLRVVEMALADVVHESERARSPTRTSPPLPPPPPARPRPPALPTPQARRKRDEQTVRLIYLSGDAPAPSPPDTSTRHVAGGVAAELAITDAQPERRATPNEEPDAMAKKKKKTAPKKNSPPKKATAASPAAEARADADASASEAETESAAARAEESSASEEKAPASRVGGAAGPSAPASKKTERPVDPVMSGSVLNMVAWTFGMLAVGLLALVFLSVLPPVSCPPGSDNCGWGWGAGCVRTSNDAENCGACGNVCASGRCVFGECAEE